ncbi:uncharacterized protein LOC100118293 isoform X2 [Nasonia vitripennis]|uniref:Uncharacterized protein n=1 Tax=Nasonia vitripennis TaxID=7425 RepID=A0A7M7QM99_NASVI|nr:uncharacterized protein LOC100118293 isoform X2 [Nasonia vitripennis]
MESNKTDNTPKQTMVYICGALGEHFAVHREFLRQPALHQMDDSEPLLYSHDTSDIQMTTPPVCKEKKHRKKQPVYYCDSIARYK